MQLEMIIKFTVIQWFNMDFIILNIYQNSSNAEKLLNATVFTL